MPSMRLSFLLPALLATTAEAATFVVDSTADTTLTACTAAAGDCTLRGALERANGNADADIIQFALDTGDSGYQAGSAHWRIEVGNIALPPIQAPVLIDGYSQPGALANTQSPTEGGLTGTPKIEIRAISASRGQQNGLEISGNFFDQPASTFRGLVINGFGAQILLHGSAAHAVEGCRLGTDVSGSSAAFASTPGRGVRVQGPGPYRIGGLLPGQRNLLSGLTTAIGFFTGSNGIRIEGNLIGSDASGLLGIGNRDNGIDSAAALTQARIGGSDPAARNLIVGSAFNAIRLAAGQSNPYLGTRIEGNWIGIAADGRTPLPNGINPSSPSQPQATMYFGGLDCRLAVGGTATGEANLIAFGAAAGIQVDQCRGLSSPLNHYLGNRGPAIDATSGGGAVGATANDAGDPDEGGNRLQNFPELTLPLGFLPGGANAATITVRVDTALANATYPIRVDLYRGDCGGGSRALLASTVIEAIDAQLPRELPVNPADGSNLLPLTALAVDAAGNSSEFAPMLGDVLAAGGFEEVPAGLPAGRCR
jgi:CSLREA domain-containing protein